MIRLKGFSKWYDSFLAVERLSLEVPEGSVHGFIGPNGAGKTTTIRFLATLVEPSSGQAWINGHDVVRDVREVRRSIGYMPDSFGVYEGMRAWEFLDFFGRAYGIPRVERDQVVNSVLELVDLDHKREDLVEALSRGMQQRLCLAKTLVHDPPVLILDEPASGLDPRARVELKEIVKELRAMGKTVLISSHVLSELADCCDGVSIIERGRLVASGSIDELLETVQHLARARVTVLERPEEAERFLASRSGVTDLERDGKEIRFRHEGSDTELAELWTDLQARHRRVIWLEEERPDLEAVFLTLTKGQVQ